MSTQRSLIKALIKCVLMNARHVYMSNLVCYINKLYLGTLLRSESFYRALSESFSTRSCGEFICVWYGT